MPSSPDIRPSTSSGRAGVRGTSKSLSSGRAVAANPKIAVPDDVAEAVRTLIRWAGDDPAREGLIDTPARVAWAWREYAKGYEEDPAVHLARTTCRIARFNWGRVRMASNQLDWVCAQP